jgi:hypothetical protein
MLSLGVPARVAMQVLGHSQISLTLGTYSDVMPELAEDAAARVGEDQTGGPRGTRTHNPRIKSPLLCQLS